MNTPYAFTVSRKIGTGMYERCGNGFNECFVLNHQPGTPSAVLSDEYSGYPVFFLNSDE